MFRYHFQFENGTETNFEIRLERSSLEIIPQKALSRPAWTDLKFNQCPNCPLDSQSRSCPVAVNLTDISSIFQDMNSYDQVDVILETEARKYQRRVPLQKALGSIVGIYMVASGCPILGQLKPMVRFHLPFATAEETQYRVLSMYLLAQFFKQRRGEEADFEMNDLTRLYEEIRVVNRSFCERVRSISGNDALPNAVVILNNFADGLIFSFDRQELAGIEKLFREHT